MLSHQLLYSYHVREKKEETLMNKFLLLFVTFKLIRIPLYRNLNCNILGI